MFSIIKIIVLIVVTILGLAAFTNYDDMGNSITTIAGYPLISFAQEGARGTIAIGQSDIIGVIVIAQAGAGVVTFAQGGLGILACIGQATAGLACISQVGVGLLMYIGQGGLGMQALGQGVLFGRKGDYFKEMAEEMDEIFSFFKKAA
ncbi:MAG: hypothetical protein GY854_19500 [Deltaproteobacteria bacterium]|nr:hypothetical protein [Deltaproteobacteria bacterium]